MSPLSSRAHFSRERRLQSDIPHAYPAFLARHGCAGARRSTSLPFPVDLSGMSAPRHGRITWVPWSLTPFAMTSRVRLRAQGLNHVPVDKRGTHQKINWARCTSQQGQAFVLSVPDSLGRWQNVAERGSLEALRTLLLDPCDRLWAEW